MVSRFEWEQASPEDERLCSERLDRLWTDLAQKRTRALLVARNDRIVCERYEDGRTGADRHYSASLAKALVGGISLTLALQDGLIRVDDPACKYVPQWRNSPQKGLVTIRHLATHTSGLEDAELGERQRLQALAEGKTLNEHHMELPGWKGRFWRQEPNPFLSARDDAPVLFCPGSDYAYSNPGMAMLSWCVTAALRGTEHEDIRTLLRERVMRPIGIRDEEWSIGYEKTFETDGLPLVANWGGGEFTPRAVARLGRLMLRKGNWDGEQILDPQWVERVSAFAGTPLSGRRPEDPRPASGLCWWVNHDGVWESMPRDAFGGAGAGNQHLFVVPMLNMVVVRNGGQIGQTFWGGVDEHLLRPLAEAFLPPCPPSPVIKRIEWAPRSEIVRRCHMKGRDGSDNWPLTWADDGDLYTAWGDGWGFNPPTETKLSMGCAKVSGSPPGIEGRNVRSNIEEGGMGRRGRKGSGILMVDGVLYLWARNADGDGHHSQLAWSEDRARTWTWADWRFEEFGYCTFLNFGPNYAGARDDFVYVYSHDNPSAYCAADRMILMRVPKERIRRRDAYEFFTGLDEQGNPGWSGDSDERGAVFTHRRRCLRSGVTYNAGLGRYLWWHQLPNRPMDSQTRFSGGFGVYDAPEPWGPWTAVHYAELWDVGPGETGSFPTKWMSEDGRTVHLVFSGNDTFAVRRAELVTE